jgi:hypothetical protein
VFKIFHIFFILYCCNGLLSGLKDEFSLIAGNIYDYGGY